MNQDQKLNQHGHLIKEGDVVIIARDKKVGSIELTNHMGKWARVKNISDDTGQMGLDIANHGYVAWWHYSEVIPVYDTPEWHRRNDVRETAPIGPLVPRFDFSDRSKN